MPPEEPSRRPALRELAVGWLHLGVLWTFAFAQPLFDVLAGDPAFFVARGNTSGDILLFAFSLVFVPPTLLVAVEALLLPFDTLRRAIHLLFVAILGAVFALQVLGDVAPGTSSAILIPLAALVGAGVGAAYSRGAVVRSALTVLSPAPILFLALFLLASDVSKLVLPQDAEQAGATVSGRTPVVLVIFDEFSGAHLMNRRGAIDAKRFPNFASLARGSTWYPNATTVADQTSRAVPAILTGSRPSTGKLPIVSDYPNNLFTLLGDDYRLDVHEMATQLCPESLCTREREPAGTRLRSLARDLRTVSLRRLLPDDLADTLPSVTRNFGNFQSSANIVSGAVQGQGQSTPEARGRVFERFVDGIDATPGHSELHFQHILLPHIPWQFLPSGQQYSENGRGVPGLSSDENQKWIRDPWAARQGFQRDLLQLAYVDRLVGRLIRRLKQTGRYERSLVILTADHGVAFRPGDSRRTVTRTNFSQMASVPLFIKTPGQRRGRVETSHVLDLDILPTIADVVDAELSWKVTGRSLEDPDRSPVETVSVETPEGRRIEVPFTRFLRLRDAFLQVQAHEFGGAPGQLGLYTGGPDGDLLGRGLDSFDATRREGWRAEVDARVAFSAVDPRASVVPAYVTGRLSGVPGGQRLAVALNGRIRAVTYSYDEAGQTLFGSIVPPSALRRGSNRVEVAVIEGTGQARRLVVLGQVEAETFTLQEEGGQTTIEAGDGQRFDVKDGALSGTVDTLEVSGGGVSASGWAARADRGAADRVLVFVKGRLVAAGRPQLERKDVVATQGRAALNSGFKLTGGTGSRSVPSRSDVRVFAVKGTTASELTIAPG